MTSEMTLKAALDHTYRTRWHTARDGGKCLMSQAEMAAKSVGYIAYSGERGCIGAHGSVLELTLIGDIREVDIRSATADWYRGGLSPATINKRLNCLSAMGVKVAGCRVKEPKALKWWLTPDQHERALRWCMVNDEAFLGDTAKLANHIDWTVLTGLRVEETLRLRRDSFTWAGACPVAVLVPGLKTSTSQATLPLGSMAQAAAIRLLGTGFTEYAVLEETWRALRKAMGWPATATLKALRRSAARYLHVDCGMPLDMVRQYLRHEDIKTTMEYLRLTGGYGTEEMRRYLK